MLIGVSLIPGLAYILLGWMHGILMPALIWYSLVIVVSLWGWQLYRQFNLNQMDSEGLEDWYRNLKLYYYVAFALWSVIFILYAGEEESRLHYISIFAQMGTALIASTLLVSDKRLFALVLLILMVPLILFFSLIGEVYSYILAVFSAIFLGVLYYSAHNIKPLTKHINLCYNTAWKNEMQEH